MTEAGYEAVAARARGRGERGSALRGVALTLEGGYDLDALRGLGRGHGPRASWPAAASG